VGPAPDRRFWLETLAAAAFASAVVIGAREAGWLQPLELMAYDRALGARVALTARADDRVVVVGVDEAALRRFGDPVADAALARALQAILDDGAVAIGLDLFRDLPAPPGEAALRALMAASPRLIVVYAFGTPDGALAVPPPAAVTDEARHAFADVPLDADGVVRRGLLFATGSGAVGWSLALRLAERALADAGVFPASDPEAPERLRLGAASYAPLSATTGLYQRGDPGGYQFLATFPAGRAGVAVWSFEDVLDGETPAGAFRDRIVLIGLTDAVGSRDEVRTPVALGPDAAQRLPGVLWHAHAVVQLLREASGEGRPLGAMGDRAAAALIVALALHGAALGASRGRWRLRLAAIAATAALIAGGSFALILRDVWAPAPSLLAAFAVALVVSLAAAARRHGAERAAVFRLFGMHLSPRIAEIAWAERETFMERGLPQPMELTATVLVSDLARFSEASRDLAPAALMRWVNRYVGRMTALIDAEGGIVEKYSGDGIMAVFGIPSPRATEAEIDADCRAAADAALAMRAALAALNAANRAEGLPLMRMRIGLATGRLIAGTTGGINRLQYTVLGDAANVATRLEAFRSDAVALGPDAGCARILMNEETARRLGPSYATALYDPAATLRGQETPVVVFALHGRRGDASPKGGPDA
jgi:adenylate cyclase